MKKQMVVLENQAGLHLRPAGTVCKTAMEYRSHITLNQEEISANAKSVLSVLGAGLKTGDQIEIICEGEDEQEALEAMVRLFESGLES